MNIPPEIKERLLSELAFTRSKMIEEEDITRKLYFLSAVSGAVERALRFHNDDELLVAHFVFQVNYSVLKERITLFRNGDTAIPLPGTLWEHMATYLDEFSTLIQTNQTVFPVIKKLAHLTYELTGPGYYTLSYLEFRR